MPASSSGLGLRLLWRPLGFLLNKCVFYMHINFPLKFHQNLFTLTITFIVLNVSTEFVLIYRPHPVLKFMMRYLAWAFSLVSSQASFNFLTCPSRNLGQFGSSINFSPVLKGQSGVLLALVKTFVRHLTRVTHKEKLK
jgi:hypothetical protein